MQKKSQNLTLEKVKETFQATDWNESKAKQNSNIAEAEDDEDDSDFDEQKALEEQKRSTEMWDDEENVIEEGPQAEEDGEDEISIQEEDLKTEEKVSEKASLKADEKMESDSEISDMPRARQRRVRTVNSQASSIKSIKAKKAKTREAAKGFFDEEAELGSDDENKDDNRKAINKDDAEENEEGMDSDLEGFVAKGDDVEIGDAEEGALDKFMQDMKEDDKKRTQIAMQAALFGQNRKRKRGQVMGEDDDMDDYQKRKQERL